MKVLPEISVVLLILVAHLVTLGLLLRHRPKPPQFTLVRPRQLLTSNEIEFLARLRRALPGFEVFPQVSMGALMDVNVPGKYAYLWSIRRQFGMKIVDFVICQKTTMRVVAAVELDDKSHDSKRREDAARDSMLRAAGIRTIRWDSRNKPSESEIAERFRMLLVGRG